MRQILIHRTIITFSIIFVFTSTKGFGTGDGNYNEHDFSGPIQCAHSYSIAFPGKLGHWVVGYLAQVEIIPIVSRWNPNPVPFLTDGICYEEWIQDFNRMGQRIRLALYSGEGELKETIGYVYDENNRCDARFSCDSKGILTDYLSHQYDPSGRLLETVQYASGGHVIETSVFDYGEGSDPVQVITTDAKGCVENTIHQYDEKGSRIETTIFDQNDEIKTVEKFQYNEDRQLISRWLYNTKGELYSYWIYGYDAIGRRIEENLYTAQKGLEMKWLYQYNERGDVVEETIHGAKKSRISKEIYTYNYDDHGNWTVKVTYSFLLRKGQYTPNSY